MSNSISEVKTKQNIKVKINGNDYEREVDYRVLLVNFIRDSVELTGTHVGCDTSNCGACTVIMDGNP